jgi:hypothetical protein
VIGIEHLQPELPLIGEVQIAGLLVVLDEGHYPDLPQTTLCFCCKLLGGNKPSREKIQLYCVHASNVHI